MWGYLSKHNLSTFDQSPKMSLLKKKKIRVKMTIFAYIGSYLAMPKIFGQYFMKNFDITKNIIGKGMLLQTFKSVGQEWSSWDSYKESFFFCWFLLLVFCRFCLCFCLSFIYYQFAFKGKKLNKKSKRGPLSITIHIEDLLAKNTIFSDS